MAENNGIYPYKPSKAGAVLFAIFFGISTLYHIYQIVRSKAWFYTSFVVGAIMMTVGYACRYISAQSPADLGPYIAQSLFIILPPSLYAATIYMIYGRMVLFVNAAETSIIRPQYVTKIFVCGDVLAFFLQAGGGGMMAVASMTNTGQAIMLIGLFVQLLFFGFFLVISLIFYQRIHRFPSRSSIPQYGKYTWSKLYQLLLCAAIVIIIRCIFRIIEFAQGHAGYIASHEIYMYIFDSALMLGVQILFHFVRADGVFGSSGAEKMKDSDSIINLYARS